MRSKLSGVLWMADTHLGFGMVDGDGSPSLSL